jgi:1-acyl-sn-glycerol-3-phosphate acyltransferase
MKTIAGWIMRVLGWKITGKLPEELQKAVIIVAPHTSLWDFVYGRLAFWLLNIPVKFMISAKYFKFPLGWLLTILGGEAVTNSKPLRLLLEILDKFKNATTFYVVITPEGTRSLVEEWKRGFYQIATRAEVPIVMAYIDYKEKKGGLGPVFYPTGDFEKDLSEIQQFYLTFHARHPERFHLSDENRQKKINQTNL